MGGNLVLFFFCTRLQNVKIMKEIEGWNEEVDCKTNRYT